MTDFAQFVSDFHAFFCEDANKRVELGLPDGLDRLPDPSVQAAQSRARSAVGLLSKAEALRPRCGDFDEGLDLQLATLKLEAEAHRLEFTFNGRTTLEQLPRAGEDIGGGLFLLLVNDPRPASERLDDITARVAQIPSFVDGTLARLNEPVKRWVQMDLDQVAGLGSLFETIESWAKAENYQKLSALQTATNEAQSALRAYALQLAELPSTTQLHVGEQTAQRIVALRGIAQSFEQLHAMARDFLSETRATIEALRGSLVEKYSLDAATTAPELQRYLNERYRVALPTKAMSDVLERYERERGKIDQFIRERRLFPILEGQDIKIMQTPKFMAPTIPAGAMLPPPPFRDGVRTSLVYLTLAPQLLDEHTELSIPMMMIHEGIPGHHLQLATASTHPSLIRRHVEANEHAEGWTTMLEDYMLDVGYMGELSDEARFSCQRDISRIGARVAIDLYFMTGERDFLDVGVQCDISPSDPFEAAANLLQAVTGFVPERVQAELNWYSQERGYPLSYLVGNRMVWQLKDDMRAASQYADEYELDRAFHQLYLHSGNMPLQFLRQVFSHAGLLPQLEN